MEKIKARAESAVNSAEEFRKLLSDIEVMSMEDRQTMLTVGTLPARTRVGSVAVRRPVRGAWQRASSRAAAL